MKLHLRLIVLSLMAAGGVTAVAQQPATPSRHAPPAPVGPKPVDRPVTPPEASAAKRVLYNPQDVARIKTKLRYTTLIILPKDEVILDFVCGDKDRWVINGEQNFAYVKPAKENAQTNLNLITESGNVYSFVLSEISAIPADEPDLKVFVEPRDGAMSAATQAPRRFVPARELDDARREAERAQQEARQVKASSQAAIDSGISRFVTNVRFAYRFVAGQKPFFVRAMYHDDRFTYIQARPEETPTLYEIQDGKPNLVNFQYDNGVYVVDKVLDSGYLAVGKARLKFTREE
jgi:type IV secretory pathway VirB9-like protein